MTGQKKSRTKRERLHDQFTDHGSGAVGSQPSEPRVAEFRPRKPRKTISYPPLPFGDHYEERKDLRLRRGTPESRRRLRYGFRASSNYWEQSRPCYLKSCVANASQAPHLVPITVRPVLKCAYPTGPGRVKTQSRNDNLIDRLSGLELHIQLPSRPGSVILPVTFAPI